MTDHQEDFNRLIGVEFEPRAVTLRRWELAVMSERRRKRLNRMRLIGESLLACSLILILLWRC